MDRTDLIKNLKSVHNNLPIGTIATALGAMTLANVYVEVGFPFVKDFFAFLSVIVLLLGLLKVVMYPKTIMEELELPIIASLFPIATMLTMVLGNYILRWSYPIGKSLWVLGIVVYIVFMIFVTYKHIIKNFNYDLLAPSFFVPYVGILVACVASVGMNEPFLCKLIFYFGTTAYVIILPFMLFRVFTKPIHEKFYPTVIIFVAPPSLVLISYLNVFANPNVYIVEGIFLVIFLFLIYGYSQIPRIVSKPFHAGFASLTFPMAASCFASYRASLFLKDYHVWVSKTIWAMVSLELVIATTIVTFVIYSLFVLLFRRLSSKDAIE
ncbi:MAG: TDT family transporter [Bacillaceae bacterium]